MDSPIYDSTESREEELRLATIFVASLAIISVALRFYARWTKRIKNGIDDWTILVALGALFALLALLLLMVHFGLGLHTSTLDVDQVTSFGETLVAFQCGYIITVAIVKISILLMYRRAFDIRHLRVTAAVLGLVVVVWATAFIFIFIFRCTPVDKNWNPAIQGQCIELKSILVGNAVPNILIDVTILALPLRTLWRLDASLSLRVQLFAAFLLGNFVVFISIYRTTTIFHYDMADITWTLSSTCEWTVIECASGIIGVCLPALAPFLHNVVCFRNRRHSIKSFFGTNPSPTLSHLPFTNRIGNTTIGTEPNKPCPAKLPEYWRLQLPSFDSDRDYGENFFVTPPPNCIMITEERVTRYSFRANAGLQAWRESVTDEQLDPECQDAISPPIVVLGNTGPRQAT